MTLGSEWSFRSIVRPGHVSNLKLNSDCKNVMGGNALSHVLLYYFVRLLSLSPPPPPYLSLFTSFLWNFFHSSVPSALLTLPYYHFIKSNTVVLCNMNLTLVTHGPVGVLTVKRTIVLSERVHTSQPTPNWPRGRLF
jgi:hypothetical protein